MRRRFNKSNDARRRARKQAPKASGTRVIPDKRHKAAKHKKPLRDVLLLSE